MASQFSSIPAGPPIEIFALSAAYKQDPCPHKVDLGIGAYRDNNAKPWVLPVVRKVEKELAADDTLNHEYFGQSGNEEFVKAAVSLLLGADSPALLENRTLGIQGLSGTGSLRIGADFLARCAGLATYYLSTPTWPNHTLVFNHAGFKECKWYRYWDNKNRCIDIDGMLEDLSNAPENAVVVLHVCAHNPTGMDPSEEQWSKIADVIESRKLFPFFDCAYQGFASGDLERDNKAVRYFVSRGFELFCAQSFAKNLGLYNERIGNLTMVFKDPAPIPNVRGQMALIVRGNYSNPPCQGSRIVTRVLTNPQLFEEWKGNIKEMSGRIADMRKALRSKLEELGTPGTWKHVTDQYGMFSYTGLTPEQVASLVSEYHIYLTKNGRISICGLNTNNVEYVAKAMHTVITKT